MYTCDICNYSTNNQSNLYYHNKSTKHIFNIEINKLKNLEELLKIKDDENEILKQQLVVTENVNYSLLKYIDLILQDKNNLELQNYKKKCIIPATLKNSLWRKYFNESIVGKCCCCKTENISYGNFGCGYIISKHNGGLLTLDNLKPVCRLCKSSMRKMNMDEFIKKYGLDCITVNK